MSALVAPVPGNGGHALLDKEDSALDKTRQRQGKRRQGKGGQCKEDTLQYQTSKWDREMLTESSGENRRGLLLAL